MQSTHWLAMKFLGEPPDVAAQVLLRHSPTHRAAERRGAGGALEQSIVKR
ncbi:hypothetical protein [Paraburkholderia sp. A1RO-1]